MSYYGWKPYVSVAARRRKAEKAAAKATQGGAKLSPVAPYRGAIAKSFWGKAWCDNLERYSDYANRLPRGRTYVRNGSVIDLQLSSGAAQARVMGSSLYTVSVAVEAVAAAQWQAISADCAGSIDSLVELLQGKLSTAVMERICKPGSGLFPAPREIKCRCSCPDSASMCKHIAAVLYGVGARLDQQPELLFTLRRVDARDLVAQAGASLSAPKKGPRASKVLDASALAGVFDIEMAELAAPAKAVAPRKKPVATKPPQPLAKPAAPRSRPTASTVKKSAAQSPASNKAKRSAAIKSETTTKLPVPKPVKTKPQPPQRPISSVKPRRSRGA